MEKTKYEECKIEVIVFDGQDVIVTSPGDCDDRSSKSPKMSIYQTFIQTF